MGDPSLRDIRTDMPTTTPGFSWADPSVGMGAPPKVAETPSWLTNIIEGPTPIGFLLRSLDSLVFSKPADGADGTVKAGRYEFPDKNAGDTPYVGQSSNIPGRLQQHEAAGRYTPGTAVVTEVEGGKTAREIAEYLRIQEITGGVPARQSNAVSNRVDPIGPKRQYLIPKE